MIDDLYLGKLYIWAILDMAVHHEERWASGNMKLKPSAYPRQVGLSVILSNET